MKRFYSFCCLLLAVVYAQAQAPQTYTSSELLLQIKKMNVLGSVLYIAAHPDDENTRLMAYLANEKLYRTGYLSITRGDGGQNLIGEELGIDLGLIRTQELLAARRIDGAEQFFSSAYDFGFCKSPEEALATWGHQKTLSDVVWVVRKFKPDVIIARFPEDSRAGHGHHAASGILAREAFDAAADPTKFPEQLTQGVSVWQAKRMLWNTFNFGSGNTQNENQFKVDVGMYNPLLGKSYGEIAALSRSQHKSQGFGVPAQRGVSIEYFETIKGEKPVADLFDGVDVSWKKMNASSVDAAVAAIVAAYDLQNPAASVKSLVALYNTIATLDDGYWKQQKLKDLQKLVEHCSGLFVEATAASQYAVLGDSLKINVTVNNRLGIGISPVKVKMDEAGFILENATKNTNVTKSGTIYIGAEQKKLTQPYWLQSPMSKGSFNISYQPLIGTAENEPWQVAFEVSIEGTGFTFLKPLRYKFTDPVKGEVYQPVHVVPQVTLSVTPTLDIRMPATVSERKLTYHLFVDGKNLHPATQQYEALSGLPRGAKYSVNEMVTMATKAGHVNSALLNETNFEDAAGKPYMDLVEINYDHIPAIKYFKPTKQQTLVLETKIAGQHIGYIPGAGDKVPQALEQMGYQVTLLKEADISLANIKKYDAIITGIRAYNTNDWMGNVYETFMQYVQQGGVLLTQYNTSNFISNVKSKIGPYPFSISRTRVTDETATVNILLPDHPALHYPNKITEKDFEGWVQERSIYHADKIDSNYQRIFSMADAGEKADEGSLIIANYGKGKFVYTGLVFFRELPAGVPGAYRLFANLIAPLNPPKGRTLEPSTYKTKMKGKKTVH